jgi:hypothetical protein
MIVSDIRWSGREIGAIEKRLVLCFSIFFLFFLFDLLLFSESSYGQSPLINKQLYSPEVRMEWIPNTAQPPPDSEAKIYAEVIDKYGEIQNATLFYKVEPDPSLVKEPFMTYSNKTSMNLVNGNKSNGTWLGILPLELENSIVHYNVYLKDNMGYTYNSSDKYKNSYHVVKDGNGPVPESVFVCNASMDFKTCSESQDKRTKVYNGAQGLVAYSRLTENSSGTLSAELFASYYNDSSKSVNSVGPIHMQKVNETDGVGNTEIFKANLNFNLPENHNIIFHVNATDHAGNPTTKDSYKAFNETIHSCSEHPDTASNNFMFNVAALDIDPKARTAQVVINFTQKGISKDVINNRAFTDLPFIDGINVDSNFRTNPKNYFYIPINSTQSDKSGCSFDISGSKKMFLTLWGDTSNYPFDRYTLNIYFVPPPIEKKFIGAQANFSSLKSMKISPVNTRIVNYPDPLVRNLDHQCLQIAKSIFPGPFVDRWLASKSQICPTIFGQGTPEPNSVRFEEINGTTYDNATDALRSRIPLLNVQVQLERAIQTDHTIAVIIIPILSIFYLLGATFMFEQTKGDSDAIANRLLLTLGIFALIFTLPGILDEMKPETSASTIGDSLLSIIVVASIAFTVSSIILSTPTIQGWFPSRFTWIDGITFIIISIVVIVLLWNYNLSITLWLVPIIIFGLGYGLLLRILGLKIKISLRSKLFNRKHKYEPV